MSITRPNSHLTRVGWLFVIGSVVFGCISGATGIILSQPPIDRAYHDTYYVVAHFHYVLSLAAFTLIPAAAYFGLSRIRRFRFPSWAGYLHAATFLTGVSMTFVPQYFIIGDGFPRRYIDYPEAFAYWNWWSSLGAFLTFASLCLFVLVLVWQIVRAWLWPKDRAKDFDPRFE